MELTRLQKGLLFRESIIAFERLKVNCDHDPKISEILMDDHYVQTELNLITYADNNRKIYYNVKSKLEDGNKIRFYLNIKYEKTDIEEKFDSLYINEIENKIDEVFGNVNKDICTFNKNNIKLHCTHEAIDKIYKDLQSYIEKFDINTDICQDLDEENSMLYILLEDCECDREIRIMTNSSFSGEPIIVLYVYDGDYDNTKWYEYSLDDISAILDLVKEELEDFSSEYEDEDDDEEYYNDEDEEYYDDF